MCRRNYASKRRGVCPATEHRSAKSAILVTVLDEKEKGRRLAAARAYRGYDQKDIAGLAAERGYARGFGNSMISKIENGTLENGTDKRTVQALCEIYDFDYEVLVDPTTRLFTRSSGLLEEIQSQILGLKSVVSDVSAQVAAARLAQAPASDSSQQGPKAEPQSD